MSILIKIFYLVTLEGLIVNLGKTNELEIYKTLINAKNVNLQMPVLETKDINKAKQRSLDEVLGHERPFRDEYDITELMLNQPIYQLAKRNVTERCKNRYYNI